MSSLLSCSDSTSSLASLIFSFIRSAVSLDLRAISDLAAEECDWHVLGYFSTAPMSYSPRERQKYLPSSSLRHSISCIVLLYLSSIVNSVFSERKRYRMKQKILTDLSIENSQARIPKKQFLTYHPSFSFSSLCPFSFLAAFSQLRRNLGLKFVQNT